MPTYPTFADAALSKSAALPAAPAGPVNFAGIDLGNAGDRPTAPVIQCSIPAIAGLTNPAHGVDFTFADSADNSSFASITVAAVNNGMRIIGIASTGIPYSTVSAYLPKNVRRYVRVTATTLAGTADLSGTTATASLVF